MHTARDSVRVRKLSFITRLTVWPYYENYLIITGRNPCNESINQFFHVTAFQRCVRTSQVADQLFVRVQTFLRITGLDVRQEVIQ